MGGNNERNAVSRAKLMTAIVGPHLTANGREDRRSLSVVVLTWRTRVYLDVYGHIPVRFGKVVVGGLQVRDGEAEAR